MTFSDELRAATAKTWDATVSHRFVNEIWAGRLDPAVLARYLVQDNQVLDSFVALFGATVAGADRAEPRMVQARRLGLIAGPEHGYLTRAMDVLDVPLDDRTHPEPAGPTRELRELMDRTRRGGDYATCLTVLLVVEWIHLDWAGRTDTEPPTDPLQREWIELHRGTTFTSWVASLRLEFDRVTAALDGDGRERIGALFTRMVELQLAFFDVAYA